MTRNLKVAEIHKTALKNLTKNALNYYESGADYEQTLSDNQFAYRRYKVRPRVLKTNKGNIDLSVEAFGQRFKLPIFIAPTAMQKMAHTDGEIGTASASLATGTCMGVSTLSTTSYENLVKAVPNAFYMMQLYIYKKRKLSEELIRRAEKAGFKAIILTVDTPILGRRIADVKEKFELPKELCLENFDGIGELGPVSDIDGSGLMSYVSKNIENALSWKDIEWIRSITRLPIYLKGIITRENAEQCLRNDVQGIIVSNHGGRQLDGVPATIDALSEVVRAVRGRLPVYVDGGIRQGSDVFKALALGATGVFIGRPVLYGLAYAGQKGVKEVVQVMAEELKTTMRFAGCERLRDINASMVVHESRYGINTVANIKRNWALTPGQPVCMEDIKESIKLKVIEQDNSSVILNENEERIHDDSFKRLRLRPYRLRGIPSSDTSVDLYGTRIPFPVCLINDTMDNGYSKGLVEALNIPTHTDDVINVPWFLCLNSSSPTNQNDIKKAESKGCKGFLLNANHGDVIRNVTSLKSMTSLPVLIRGVMSKEDALVCMSSGIDGIVVANCGNQEIDDSLTAIDVLPEIAEVVNGKIPLFMEGGIRKGTDIFKALARGATSVFINKPLRWGYIHKGEEGVQKVLQILEDEFQRTMLLSGCANVGEIVPSMVVNERYFWTNNEPTSKL